MRGKKTGKRLLAGLCIASMLPVGAGTIGYAQDMDTEVKNEQAKASMNQKLKLWYTTPANINTSSSASGSWMRESLPLGNGTMGNLIFGGITKERVHFNEKSLWTGGPSPKRPDYEFGNKKTAYTAEEIEEYRQVLDDKSENVFNDTHGVGYAPIRFPGATEYKGSYQDFGDIWLDYAPTGITDENVTDYRRELDIQTGIASTKFTYDNVEYKREHFVSAPDNVMVTELTASEAGKLSVDVSMTLNNNELTRETFMNADENTYSIQGKVKDNDLQYRTTMKVVPTGGTITADEENGVYHVENADSIMIVMAAETDYINDFPTYRDADKDLAEVVDQRAITNAAKDYEDLKAAHLADHQELFDRVELDLGEDLSNVPTNQLVDQYRKGDYSKYLEVLSYQYGRYLSIAGSRGILPSNLCGLWTVGAGAWTGDYHFNVNVQMNYWPVYVNNLAECGKTFVDYMDGLREPGRITAERVHGIENAIRDHKGFVVHTGSNPFGMTAPSNAQEYGWNPGGIAWAIQNVWQDYEFTEDSTYLKEKLYPIMKEAATFWDNYLWESKYQKIDDETSSHNGGNRLVVSPSVSAEQGPTVNGSTYDQSLVWELYKECITAGKIVGEDEAVLADWADKMERLDPININQTGGIKEWYEETRVGTETGHNQSYAQAGDLPEVRVPNSGWYVGHPGEQRHASHLVGLYPGTLINKDNKEYMDAAVQSLEERGFYSTGWSKANKVNLWARTGNGNNAYRVLKNLIGGNSSGLQYNLFDSHGSGGGDTMMNGSPVWQIDGNYGLTAGVAEMLVQSQLGYTQFLPAIPDEWSEGSVEGLKARGNFTIGETWEFGLPKEFTVCYEGEKASSVFTAEYSDIANAKVYADGKEVDFTVDEATGHISFEAVKGTTYTIDMSGTNQNVLKDKLAAVIAEAEEKLAGEYTKDTLYVLKKAVEHAKDVMANENAAQSEVIEATEALKECMKNLQPSGDVTEIVPPSELKGGPDWWTSDKGYRYTYYATAGKLTYEFEGNAIQVLTVKGSDHGVLRAVITDAEGKEVYNKEIDTYKASREEGAVLLKENLEEGKYTIAFECVGKSPSAPSARGYVEVGNMTIWRSTVEVVDRTALEAEIAACDALDQNVYTAESWEALQAVLTDAKEVLAKADEDTCTAEMEDYAAQLAAAREALVEEEGVEAYTVNVENGTGAGKYTYNAEVTVTANAPEEGMKFEGWRVVDLEGNEGEIISTQEKYTFYVSNNVTLKATYVEETVKVEEKAQALVTNVMATKNAKGTYDVKFVGQIVLPEGYTIEKAGLVWSSKEATDLVLSGKLKPTYVTKISETNQFSVTIKGMPAGRFLRGKIFATVKNATGTETVYSAEERAVTTK